MAKHGEIVWHDLTVPDARGVNEFYSAVLGWQSQAHEQHGGDYTVYTEGVSDPVGGICYARGVNANLPAHWLIYVQVDDVDKCSRVAIENGGKCIEAPRLMSKHRFCVIQDPAGAFLALIGNP